MGRVLPTVMRKPLMAERPSEVLNRNRENIRQIVSLHRAANPRIFGSTLGGADDPSSDLDILVDPLPGATLFDLGALQVRLEEALGVPVDVLTPGDLPMKFRAEVLQRALPV
jgi:predicted nucleotidyltransferase